MSHVTIPLAERTLQFSKAVIALCKQEPASVIGQPIISQLIRSATSIGANYAEANNAASKADFKNKIYTAKKEAAETEYWLALLSKFSAQKSECRRLYKECHYMLMTLQKIINTLRHGR